MNRIRRGQNWHFFPGMPGKVDPLTGPLFAALPGRLGCGTMKALVYLSTPAAAAAWTWINGHHYYAPASTVRATGAHRPRPIISASHPAASLHGGGEHNAEEQLLALGRRHAQDGDLESAILQFERAASQAPRSAACKVELGRALVQVGRAEEGFDCLVAAFGIDSLCPGVKDGFREYYRAEIEASTDFSFV